MVSWQKYKVGLVVWSTVLNLNAKSDNWVRQEKNLTNKALFISFSYISSFHLFFLSRLVGLRSWNQLLAKGWAAELSLRNFIFSPKPSFCLSSFSIPCSLGCPAKAFTCSPRLTRNVFWKISLPLPNLNYWMHGKHSWKSSSFTNKNHLGISFSHRNLIHALFTNAEVCTPEHTQAKQTLNFLCKLNVSIIQEAET